MVKAELSDEQIKVEIMQRLLRKGCWGKVYLPVDSLARWVGGMIRRDGRRVRKLLDEMTHDGYLGRYKKGETIYLNFTRRNEVISYIQKHLGA